MKLSETVKALNLNVFNDGSFRNLGKLNALDEDNTLSFLTEEKYIPLLKKTDKVTCLIVRNELIERIPFFNGGIIVSENPKSTFFMIHRYLIDMELYQKSFKTRIAPSAKIAKTAVISEKNVEIGENVIIEDYVVIKENTIIGDNSKIRSGTVISSSGFEAEIIDNIQKIVPHAGWVIIGKNVEIQANCTISKGLFPSKNTIIQDEVITDNLVHIGHGSIIGKRSRIAPNATISGNVTIGKKVWIGPSVTISNNIIVKDYADIVIGSVVISDIEREEKVSGNFALNHIKNLRNNAKIRLNK